MRRREFLAAFGGAAMWATRARSQQPDRIRRIGYLTFSAENDPVAKQYLGALVQGLRQLGWIEGHNLQIDFRRATGGVITKDVADDLVRSQPDVLITSSTVGVRFLQQATRTTPIVFVSVSDPVRDGFVASLARPGGNITGFSNYEPQMASKWYELLKAIAPRVTQVIILFNPNTAPHSLYMEHLKTSALSFGLEAVPAPAQTSADLEAALSRIGESGSWGMVAIPDSFLFFHRNLVSELAARYRVPAVYPFRYHVTSGGLVSYGVDQTDQFARAATYIDRILKGEKPADLPVQGPAKFETVINLKTAKALELDVPDSLLAGADEIIE